MAYTSAQIQEALRRSGFNRTANASDMRAANKFGLNVFARSRANIGRTTGPGSSAPTATVEAPDITQQFIDGLKPYLTSEKKPNVTPFDQAGFYDEKDARALADQEYDPYYQRIKEEQDRQNAAQDRTARRGQRLRRIPLERLPTRAGPPQAGPPTREHGARHPEAPREGAVHPEPPWRGLQSLSPVHRSSHFITLWPSRQRSTHSKKP